ncbi:MAG: hypothetical protein BWX72_02008 [Firmicutes bacterium ADurb.Bin080]|nr:MAG: hypothetical protein BWX72_02008 [Firmicutes bacterium ADurb.Bin080]
MEKEKSKRSNFLLTRNKNARTIRSKTVETSAQKDDVLKGIVFYFRKKVSAQGDFSLYYKIAYYISEKYDIPVFCVNNSYPELQKQYFNSRITFCDITKDNVKQFEGMTFVVAFNQLFCLLEEIFLLKKARILPLFLHPYIIEWWESQFEKKLYNFDRIVKMLKKNNSFAFQDEANYFAFERHTSIKLYPRYFPVVINTPDDNMNYCPDLINKTEINCAWLGRLDPDKIYSIINFLDVLYSLNIEKNINVHIIGDGAAKNRIDINKYTPKLRLIFTSYLYGEKRNEYLMNNVDFVVAMGVSAIDIASIKLPTILPIVSTSSFYKDVFVYFNNSINYCLGWKSEDIEKSTFRYNSLIEIINDIYEKEKKQEIGNLCFFQAKNVFSIEKNISQIMECILSARLTVRKFKRNPSIVNQIFLFKLFKLFKKNEGYLEYVSFHNRFTRFSNLSTKMKIKKLYNKIISILKNKFLWGKTG